MVNPVQLSTYAGLTLAVILVSGNNLSACVSTAVGARVISIRKAQLLGGLGYSLGVALQGKSMTKAVKLLLPTPSGEFILEVFAVTVIIFVLAKVTRVPISLTMALVGLLLGASLSNGVSIDRGIMIETVTMWFITPVIAVFTAYTAVRVAHTHSIKNPWRRLAAMRLTLVVLSFTSSYTLGSNTLGFLVALTGYTPTTLLIGVTSAFLGAITLSSGEIRRVGGELYSLRYTPALVTLLDTTLLVEAATLLGVPLSNTQALSSGVFGAALGYRFKYLRIKPYLIIVAGWIITPLLSLALGYIISTPTHLG
ncbi:MAG: inorganic phosphate transporter [Thermoprotei archaeon]